MGRRNIISQLQSKETQGKQRVTMQKLRFQGRVSVISLMGGRRQSQKQESNTVVFCGWRTGVRHKAGGEA